MDAMGCIGNVKSNMIGQLRLPKELPRPFSQSLANVKKTETEMNTTVLDILADCKVIRPALEISYTAANFLFMCRLDRPAFERLLVTMFSGNSHA